jgi:methyltransferase (TIGR00027 family)
MGVGLTAFMVAAARAIETHRHDALAQDFYAEQFVRAAPACDKWPVHIEDVPNGDANPLWGRLGRYFGLRTRVFDDYLLAAAHTGVRQVVLLGAGFDSRAFRLGWPKGCVVFELDQEPILRFKQEVLDGSRPQARRIAIATDLTGNWADQLISAGFDPAGPSVWLAGASCSTCPARPNGA